MQSWPSYSGGGGGEGEVATPPRTHLDNASSTFPRPAAHTAQQIGNKNYTYTPTQPVQN